MGAPAQEEEGIEIVTVEEETEISQETAGDLTGGCVMCFLKRLFLTVTGR